jgi:hypothetical protein
VLSLPPLPVAGSPRALRRCLSSLSSLAVHASLPPYEQLLIAAVAGSTLANPSVDTLIRQGGGGVVWAKLVAVVELFHRGGS